MNTIQTDFGKKDTNELAKRMIWFKYKQTYNASDTQLYMYMYIQFHISSFSNTTNFTNIE